MDAMSVSAAIGVRWNGPGQKFRLAWHMGLFQFAMPLVGFFAGRQISYIFRGVGNYLAAILVFGIGAKMLYEALRSHPGATAEEAEHILEQTAHIRSKDPTRGWSLLALSLATSIDALVAGFSLGIKDEGHIWTAAIVIGLVAGLMSLFGVMIGQRIGKAIDKRAELTGAVVVMMLGVSFLFW